MSAENLGRVLVVDDELQLMEVLVEALSSKGYVARGFLSGVAAVEALQQQEYDLLLTDLMMPGMDGIALLRACKAIDPNLEGIIMTGQGTVQTAIEAMKSGAYDYILKPFRLDAIAPVLARAREMQKLRLENVQLRETVAIYDLSQTIALSLDSKRVLENTADAALQQTDADEVSIMLLTPDQKGLFVAAVRGRDREHLLGRHVSLQEGIAGWVARHPEPLILSGELPDSRFVPIQPRPDIRSALCIPMMAGGKLIGILNVNSLQARHLFSPGQVKALSILTSSAAAALENESLFNTLEARERRFRSLIENAPDGIALLGLDRKLIHVTPSTEKILGYTQEEAKFQDPSQLTHPDDLPALLTQLNDLIQNPGSAVHTEYRFQHKDGSWRWLSSTISNLLSEPSVAAIVFNYQDITVRKQAEDALRESEQRLRNLFENSPVSIWEKDFSAVKGYIDELRATNSLDLEAYLREHPEVISRCLELTKLIDVNQASLKLHEAADKASLLRNLQDTFAPESYDTFRREILAVANGEKQIHLDVVVQTLKGHRRDATMSWVVVPGHEETYARVLVSLVDITERKRTERELVQSEIRYRLATKATNDVIWEWNPLTHQLLWTDNAKHVFGYLPEEIGPEEKWWDAHIHPDDRERVSLKLDALLAGTGSNWLEEYRFQRRDGSYLYISDHGYIERDASGKPVRMIGAMSDITERKQAEQRIHHQLQRLNALRAIDLAISSTFDMNMSLTVLLGGAVSQLQVSAAAVLLFNESLLTLEYAAGHGFNTSAIQQTRLKVGEGYAGRSALEHTDVFVPDLTQPGVNFLRADALKEEAFVFYYGVPLIAKGELKGVLEIFHRAELEPNQEWLDFLHTLAGQAAIAIDNGQLFEGLRRSNLELALAYDAAIEGWSKAMDLRDKETEGHTQRVTELTIRLATAMKVSTSDLIHIRRGALLHDMGKLGVPDNILLKPGKLTSEEWEIMRKHPQFAYDMLSEIQYLKPALDIPYCHHEKWDGSGYPRQLKGEQIPLAARIFAVVDVWDALTSDRPYRMAWSVEKAAQYIKEQAGRHFDPDIVNIFLDTVAPV